MRFANIDSWRISVRADEQPTVFALWLRDVEAIEVPPDHDPADLLGSAALPLLHGYVTRRWPEFLDWRVAHHRAHGTFTDRRPEGLREHDVVREVEKTLGRRAAPFSLAFTLLPVRDDRIRAVDPAHCLVPERVYLGPAWPTWLRAVVTAVA